MTLKARLDRLTRRLPSPPLPPIRIRDVVPAGDGRFHAEVERDGQVVRFVLAKVDGEMQAEEVTP